MSTVERKLHYSFLNWIVFLYLLLNHRRRPRRRLLHCRRRPRSRRRKDFHSLYAVRILNIYFLNYKLMTLKQKIHKFCIPSPGHASSASAHFPLRLEAMPEMNQFQMNNGN